MATISHAFAGWPIEIDPSVFDMHLAGYTAAQAALATHQAQTDSMPTWLGICSPSDEVALAAGASNIVLQDIQDQYRLIDYLVPYLQAPEGFVSRGHMPLSQIDRFEMIRRYYAIDDYCARVILGSKLNKPDIDALVLTLGEFGYSEATVTRICDNVKRLGKSISATLKARQTQQPSKPLSLKDAVEQVFTLSGDLSSRYTTLIFALEHHLFCKALAGFSFAETSALCSLLAATLCDDSQLFIREDLDPPLGRLKFVFSESKVAAELHTVLFGHAPAKRWPLHLGHHGEVTVGFGATTRGDLVSTVVSPNTMRDLVTSMVDLNTSSSYTVSPVPSGSIITSGASSPTLPNPPAAAAAYSKKLTSDFQVLVKTIGKLAGGFLSNRDIPELLDGIRDRIIVPFALTPTADATAAGEGHQHQRALKELSALLVQAGQHFPGLHNVSKQDHAVLDRFVADFLMLIRLELQLCLAQVCEQSVLQHSAAPMNATGARGNAGVTPQPQPTSFAGRTAAAILRSAPS